MKILFKYASKSRPQKYLEGIRSIINNCTSDNYEVFDSILDGITVPVAPESHLDTQHGGDHYKKLGDYQPWQVLKVWLTEEEFRGYMKGTAIAYLAREKDKGGDLDIKKATHTLQAFIEMGLFNEKL